MGTGQVFLEKNIKSMAKTIYRKYHHFHHSSDSTYKVLTAIFILSISSVLLLVFGSEQPPGSDPPVEFLYTFLSSACGVVSLLLIISSPSLAQLKTIYILSLALLLRTLTLFAWPLLEDDFFRYLWDGRQTAEYLSPWRFAPLTFFADETLSEHWQSILSGINHPELTSIYGPALQYLFAFSYIIAPGELWPIQSLMILADMAILLILIQKCIGKRWLLAYAVHPLLLKETVASAHPDSLMVMCLLIGWFSWQDKKGITTGFFIGLALTAKVSALIALPFLLISPYIFLKGNRGNGQIKQLLVAFFGDFNWSLKVLLGLCIALVIMYMPFLGGKTSELSSLSTFGQQWRFNPLLFRLIEQVSFIAYPRLAATTIIAFGIILLLTSWLKGNPTTKVSDSFRPPLPPIDLAFFLLLMCSPVINSWYWLWILPLAIVQHRTWLVAVCSVSICAYINSSVFYVANRAGVNVDESLFTTPWPVTWLQLSLIAILWLLLSPRSRYSILKRP